MPLDNDLTPENLVDAVDGAAKTTRALLASLGIDTDRYDVKYRFHCSAVSTEFLVRSMRFVQRLSEPYRLLVDVTTDTPHGSPEELLGKACCLETERLGHRHLVHGIVERVYHQATRDTRPTWRLTLAPALAALGARKDSRVFQASTVPEVVERVIAPVLERFGRSYRTAYFRQDYPVREYLVQYQETDLDFVQRLLAEEGIWYHFEFPDDPSGAETLVIIDSRYAIYEVETHESPPVVDLDASGGYDHELITAFAEEVQSTVGGHSLRRYDWTNPRRPAMPERPMEAAPETLSYEHESVELYDYQPPQGLYKRSDAAYQLGLRKERSAVERAVYRGASNVLGMTAGRSLRIADHPNKLNGTYLVTAVEHHGTHLREGESADEGDYENSFRCIRLDVPFRPARPPKPHVSSVQSARVVGPDGKATLAKNADGIHVDEHGRVQVRFAWDRADPESEEGRVVCWLRCAQLWSGPGFGSQFIPRIGMEVVVNFVNGDPDRPIITGCVYNGENVFPYALPEHKNRSTIMTRSNPGGSGANELRFDDTKGSEEVYVHAQHDYNELTEHDHTRTVRGCQTTKVDRSQSLAVGEDRAKQVHGNERITVKGERSTTITKKNAEVFQDLYQQTVAAAVTITHNDTRTTQIKRDDIETITDGNKTTAVAAGSYEVRSAKALTLVQDGSHALRLDGMAHLQTSGDFTLTNEKCQIESGGDKLSVRANSSVTLKAGKACIELKKDGTINITGTKISLTSGNNSVQVAQAGVTTSGVKVSSTAVGIHEIQGAQIKVG